LHLIGKIEWHDQTLELWISLDEKKLIKEWRLGFAILAIDCAVVETMGAFQEELTDTGRKSKETFAKFRSTSPRFRQHFSLARATDGTLGHVYAFDRATGAVRWNNRRCIQYRPP
jgi:hypothetical protein